jgi:hypothetical protein
MTTRWKAIASIISAVAMLAGLVFGVSAYEEKFAKSRDLSRVEETVQLLGSRLDQKIRADRIHNLQRRIWDLEREFGGVGVPTAPPGVRKEYQELILELNRLKGE